MMMIFASVSLILLLVLSALFSGMETGLLSVSRAKIGNLSEQGNPNAKIILRFLDRPVDFIGTVLVGNNICHVVLSVLSTWYFNSLFGDPAKAIAATMIVITPLLLVFGEILPKTLFRQRPHSITLSVAALFQIAFVILSPFAKVILWFVHLVIPKEDEETKKRLELLRKEIQSLVREGERQGVVEDDEVEMIEAVFDMSETNVREVMVPRVSFSAIDDDMPYEDIVKFVLDQNFTRYPVYHETPDQMLGIIHIADLLNVDALDKSKLTPPVYLPDTARIDDALEEMRLKGINLAIVVDEYGGTFGIVTIEDLLEELVGEIEDEFDDEPDKIVRVGESAWKIDGMTDIHDVIDFTHIELSEEILDEFESETIGGMVTEKLGRIPSDGSRTKIGPLEIIVLSADRKHIVSVEVTVREKP